MFRRVSVAPLGMRVAAPLGSSLALVNPNTQFADQRRTKLGAFVMHLKKVYQTPKLVEKLEGRSVQDRSRMVTAWFNAMSPEQKLRLSRESERYSRTLRRKRRITRLPLFIQFFVENIRSPALKGLAPREKIKAITTVWYRSKAHRQAQEEERKARDKLSLEAASKLGEQQRTAE